MGAPSRRSDVQPLLRPHEGPLRWLLARDYFADIVDFRADTIDNQAYDSPELAPLGIHSVYLNGKCAIALLDAISRSIVFPLKPCKENEMLTNVAITKTKASTPKKQAAKKTERTSKYSVPVVRSTFLILEELSRSELLGLREVTQNTGIPKSTVFRILNTLVELGYVTRETNRSYRISPTLGRLVSDEAASEALRRLALPLMLELRDKYGETVNLGVQHLDKVTYLEVVPSEFALRLQESRGASVLAHVSALGKAILAFSPQDVVQDAVRGRELESITQHTITDPDEFLAELKRVRNVGFAFDRGEGSTLAICIGAPILDEKGHAIAAMSISGPAYRFNPKKNAPVVTSLIKGTTELARTLAQIVIRR